MSWQYNEISETTASRKTSTLIWKEKKHQLLAAYAKLAPKLIRRKFIAYNQ